MSNKPKPTPKGFPERVTPRPRKLKPKLDPRFQP